MAGLEVKASKYEKQVVISVESSSTGLRADERVRHRPIACDERQVQEDLFFGVRRQHKKSEPPADQNLRDYIEQKDARIKFEIIL